MGQRRCYYTQGYRHGRAHVSSIRFKHHIMTSNASSAAEDAGGGYTAGSNCSPAPLGESVMSDEESIIQPFGSLVPSRLGLSEQVRHRSVAALNRLLAHTMAMRDLYKKSHWQTSGATFY